MGQNVNGIMYGVRATKEMRADDADIDLIDRYKGHGPYYDENLDLIGQWVAVGVWGERGLPGIQSPVALDEVPTTVPYAKAYERAVQQWDAFAAWAATQGVTMPPARLWLTMTEVA